MGLLSVALFTQRLQIIAAAVVRQFSADGDSQRVKHLRLKEEPLFTQKTGAAAPKEVWRYMSW